jgi:cobalamin biosynthesis Mg chelatase CobN
MSETKPESTRSLLAQIEGEWDAPKSGTAKAGPAPSRPPTEEELHAELDAAADRLVGSLEPPPLEELDSGWGDSEDEADDTDDADDANEPALPDEQLDPVAYAEAKKARDERVEARKERRRAKVEAKKARQKARALAQKSKQKGKQRKARPPQQKAARPERSAKPNVRESSDADDGDESSEEEVADTRAPARTRAKAQSSSLSSSSAQKPMLSKTNQWMLAVAVIVFVAAATFAAVVAR